MHVFINGGHKENIFVQVYHDAAFGICCFHRPYTRIGSYCCKYDPECCEAAKISGETTN